MLATDWLSRIHKSRWLAMLNPRWPNTPWRCDPKKTVKHEVHSRWDPTRIERCLSFGMSFWEFFFFLFLISYLLTLNFHMFSTVDFVSLFLVCFKRSLRQDCLSYLFTLAGIEITNWKSAIFCAALLNLVIHPSRDFPGDMPMAAMPPWSFLEWGEFDSWF